MVTKEDVGIPEAAEEFVANGMNLKMKKKKKMVCFMLNNYFKIKLQ